MSASTAELTLIIKAQNLAETELAKVRGSLSKITVTAKTVAQDVANAFKDVGRRIGRQLGNLATDILSGGSITNNLVMLGATMAGAIVEGMSAHLIPLMMSKIAATATFAPIVAAFAAGGVTAATVFDAAVAITMAALPFVILAAAVAALVYLATNPEARQKAREVALMIIGQIGIGLQALGKAMYDRFVTGFAMVQSAVTTAMQNILTNVHNFVVKIVDNILAIPRAVGKALSDLNILKNFNLDQGPAFDAADGIAGGYGVGSNNDIIVPGVNGNGRATGGWVGLHGPELSWLGERGPEYVVPNSQLGKMGGGGFTIAGVSEREIVEMVDRGLYFKLRRAAPAGGRL
jgi:hypothetical protein